MARDLHTTCSVNYEWKFHKVVAGQQIYAAKNEHGQTVFQIKGGPVRGIEAEAEADAEHRKQQQERQTVEELYPTPEEPVEDTLGDHGWDQNQSPSQGPDDEPPAATPALLKPKGKGPRR